jgi:hypothetical protein
MTRPFLLLLLLGAVVLPAGCARNEPERITLAVPPPPSATPEPPAAPPAARSGRTTRGRAAAPAAPLPADPAPPPPLSAMPRPGEVYASPPPTAAQRDQAALMAACRQQAERIILERDRGQLLREDEQAARIGASSSVADSRFMTDRLGRVFARDRMAEDCVEANRAPAPRR